MTGPGSVGGVGEEARALVEAARDWVVRTIPESHADGCRWCPVCRAAAALRDPAAAERVAGAVTTAAGTLAAFLDSLTRPGPGPAPPAEPTVQRIPLDDGP